MSIDIKELNYPEALITVHEGAQIDSVVASIITQFIKRAQFGKAKYGTDLDRRDLTTLEWIEHTKQELMDSILYLEKLKQTLSE
jgi:hypothetical protein